MLLKVRGLVVRTAKYSDYDRLVTVLTEDQGKLFFKACGINSLKNRNAAACSLFTFSEFVIKKNGENAYLSSSSPVYYPLKRGCDLTRLALAGYMAQLGEDVATDPENCSQVLKLITTALFVISKNDRDPDLIKAVFELRLLTALGFAPLLEGCSSCRKELADMNGFFFDPVEGDLFCGDCAPQGRRRISRDCVLLMKRCVQTDEKSAYAVNVEEGLLREFSSVCESFLTAQLERKYDTLDFYKEAKALK